MSYVTLPSSGTGGIIDDLKSYYEQLKPTIKEASKAYKDAKKGGTSTDVSAGEPAPEMAPPEADPSSRSGGGMMGSIPTWAIYAGVGVAVLAIFFNRSK
jgi:hypothetical protein